jgi:peptide/nickel transport system ATP-binding protein
MVDPPAGCRFNPRCPFATELCRTRGPVLLAIGAGRQVACWGYAPDEPGAPDLGTAKVVVDLTEVAR